MKKIFISGLINVEHSLSVDSFPLQYSPIEYSFNKINSTISGVGYNIVKALKTLGDDAELFSIIGDDNNGLLVKSVLEKEKISTANIKSLSSTATAESIVVFDKEGRRKIYCDLKNLQDLSLDQNIENIDDFDIAIITNINFNRPLLTLFKEKGILIASDVHVLTNIDDEYNSDFMKYADILFLSNEGIKGHEADFIKELYLRYKNKVVVVGCGSEGALAFIGQENKYIYEKAIAPLGINNTVGAGDALFSSFIHFYHKGEDIAHCLKAAVAFAGLKISSSGGSNGFVNEETLKKYL